MTAIIEVFTTPNKKTKSGEPKRWRWRISNDDFYIAKGRHSFKTPNSVFVDIAISVPTGLTGALLRVEGKNDVPWVMS